MDRRYRRVEDDGTKKSTWSSQALEASAVGPAPSAIDWDMIRKNKDEYAEIKWKGESQERNTCR